MTVKEQILSAGIPGEAFTMEDFIRQARPAIFGALSDSQKHSFIRMAKLEQEVYIEAMLREIGIKTPDMQV
jgi:hypothetical protein